MNGLKKSAILVALLSIASCSHIESYLDIAKDKGVSKAYIEILNQWTRKDTIYSQFETKMMISTTYKGEAFNRGYLREYARIYSLTDAEIKHREETLHDFPAASTEFLFYASMADREANDFDKPNSIWKISLIDEKGNKFEPLEVRKIEKVSPIMEEFFPYINKYYGFCYNLKFSPIVPGGKHGEEMPPMKLVFSGVLGKVEQAWP